MYYAFKSGKEHDMVVSCPICHNEIRFKSKGKSDKEILALFETNKVILKRIYGNKDVL
jgi:hypothetical protein